MFGTFQPELPEEEYAPLKYGLTKNIEKDNASNIIFHEWKQLWKDIRRKDIGFREKWSYVFGPPGWSHDGSRLTSEQMRESEENKWAHPQNISRDTNDELEMAILFTNTSSSDK